MAQSDCDIVIQECAPSFKNLFVLFEALGEYFTSLEETLGNYCLHLREYLQHLLKLERRSARIKCTKR